jgi:outer membrane translocation and assembly module TamA
MKKFLMALMILAPMSAYALNVDVLNDVTVTGNDAYLTVDQDGNAVTVGVGGLSFSNSDTVTFGIAYDTDLLFGLNGGLSYDYATDDDHILGLDTGFETFGATIDASFAWNITDVDLTAEIGTGYSIFGLDGSLTSNWDVDDFAYNGFDVDAGYTWAVTNHFSVRPNLTVPFDDDFDRGDISAGVSIVVSFDSAVGG